MFADSAELMNQRIPREYGPVAHRDMACQRRVICHDDVVTEDTIVRDVDTGHDPVVVADYGFTATRSGSPADRAELPDGVVFTDDEFRVCTVVLLVLRLLADRGELENSGVFSKRRTAVQDYVWSYPATRADCYPWPNDAERTDFDVISDIGRRVYQRLFMNSGHNYFPAQSSSQLATRFPSTLAWHSYQPILRLMRFWMASSTSWSPGTTTW